LIRLNDLQYFFDAITRPEPEQGRSGNVEPELCNVALNERLEELPPPDVAVLERARQKGKRETSAQPKKEACHENRISDV